MGIALFALGWGLVLVSGYGGNSTAGSELVWRIGGLMAYLSVPTLLAAGAAGLVAALRPGIRRRRRRV